MSDSRNRIRSRTTRWLGVATLTLLLGVGMTPTLGEAQSAPVALQTSPVTLQTAPVVLQTTQETPAPTYTVASVGGWAGRLEGSQLPQDIRIMQRIVTTALGEVEAPPLPGALRQSEDAEEARAPRPDGGEVIGWSRSEAPVVRFAYSGGRDISGFYMQGYGYLFTINWRFASRYGGDNEVFRLRATELAVLADRAGRNASESAQEAEARAASEARQALEVEREKVEQQRDAWNSWAADYRGRLAEELAGVIAQYGSTLNRARPDESITFIADFGGGDSETVTVTARRGDLNGAGRDENLGSVRLSIGEAEISEAARTELKIMSAIIDSSLQGGGDGESVSVYAFAGSGFHLDGGSGFQYVPGYGVLFRKSARLNLATRVIQSVAPSRSGTGASVSTLRDRIDESTEEQRETYADHLEDLKSNTAEMLSTYGPTLTHMGPNEWVGIYYDVGSAAGLLEGGISNFLVQARIESIREAARQDDPAGWLMQHLVTNEKQD